MTDEERALAERQSEDFKLFVLCHAKGNSAMYELLRDRSLDEARKPKINMEDDIDNSG